MEINVLKKLTNIFYLVSFDTVSSSGTSALVPSLRDAMAVKEYYQELAKELNQDYNLRIYKYTLSNEDLKDLEYDADNFNEFMDDYEYETIEDMIVTVKPYF